MDIFKLASQQKLRFVTSKGELTTEQLWDLSIGDLDKLGVALQKEYDNSAQTSLSNKKTPKDKTAKLRFDVVEEIYNTKVAEADEAKTRLENKQRNEKILALIEKKKDQSLEELEVEDLEKMLVKVK